MASYQGGIMITLTAVLKAKIGQEDALEAALTKLVKQVESEEDTLEYVLNRSTENSTSFMLFEVYKDNDALVSHSSTDYFKAAMKESGAFLDGQPVMEFYTEVTRIKRPL
jgi:quinol monooxygenase YgiN